MCHETTRNVLTDELNFHPAKKKREKKIECKQLTVYTVAAMKAVHVVRQYVHQLSVCDVCDDASD